MTEEHIAEVHARYTSTERDWEAFRPLMGSPIHLMRDTLNDLQMCYGSVPQYLDAIGVPEAHRVALREALIQ